MAFGPSLAIRFCASFVVRPCAEVPNLASCAAIAAESSVLGRPLESELAVVEPLAAETGLRELTGSMGVSQLCLRVHWHGCGWRWQMPAIRGNPNAGASPASILKTRALKLMFQQRGNGSRVKPDACAVNECERETRLAGRQVSGNAISSVRRPIADQAAGGASRRLCRADARLDEHSAGSRLHPHRRHAHRHRTLHGPAAAR